MISRRALLRGAALTAGGAGGLTRRADQEYDPPNAIVAPGGRSGILRARKVIIIGTGGELFVYTPTAAFGNLLQSIAASNGTDIYGNAFLAGSTSYELGVGPPKIAVQTAAGQLNFYTATTAAGPWTLQSNLQITGGDLNWNLKAPLQIGSLSVATNGPVIVPPSNDTTGTTDRVAINAAFSTAKWVMLLAGVYYIDTEIIMNSDFQILEGQGTAATSIARPSTIASAQRATVVVGSTKTVSQSGVKNLTINNSAGTGAPITNSGHGVALAVNQGVLENVQVQYAEKDGFHIAQDQVNFTTGTTTIAVASDGATLPVTPINVASTAGLTSSGNVIIETSTGPAYISYTGTAGGNQLTGCTASFTPGATLHTGQSVSQVGGLFDMVAVNCYAQFCGNNGWYIDWTYGSCEFVACKANCNSAGIKPVATGTVLGWLIYGTQIKLVVCHAFFASGYGLQLNGTDQFVGGLLTVIGGEWESCSTGGMNIVDPSGACYINGAQFYNNGIATGQSDLTLAFATKQVNVQSCTFRHAASGAVQIAQNIYMQHVSYIRITDCEFDYQFVPRAIEVDGSGGAGNACDHVTIKDNRCNGAFNGTVFVRLNDRATFCDVSGNMTDATIQEVGANPNNNRVFDNIIIPGFTATITLLGANSVARNNEGFNPLGVIASPAMTTGVARTAPQCDMTVVVTADPAQTCNIDIGGTLVCNVPAAAVVTFWVPATETITPVFLAGAPTWVWYGA